MDLATILDDCVHSMRGGESVEDCLAHYPEQAVELAPMLRAASTLEWLAGEHMPEAHRQQTRTTLRQVVTASQAMPKRTAWMAFWVRPAIRVFAGTAAVLVFLTFAITTVAASQPGDLAYPARVMAERSTLLLQRTPDGQASASLRLANNRLSELETGLALPGRAYNPALDALLAEDQGLADLTPRMAGATRKHVALQVASHAAQLEALAQRSHEQKVADALRHAAVETNALAQRIEHSPTATPAPGLAVPTPQATPAALAPGRRAPPAVAPTLGATARGRSATTSPSTGTLSKRGSKAGPAAVVVPTATPSARTSLDRGAPTASPTREGPPSQGGPWSRPQSPNKAATSQPQLRLPTLPAARGPAHVRPVSPPAVAPELRAPRTPQPPARGLDTSKDHSANGKAPQGGAKDGASHQRAGSTRNSAP
jgi:hypothetical protein